MVRGGGLFGCTISTAVHERLRLSLGVPAYCRTSGEGVAVNDSKEVILPMTTPVLDAYGSTWERGALTRAMVIGATGTAAQNLIVTGGVLLFRTDASFGEAAPVTANFVPGICVWGI